MISCRTTRYIATIYKKYPSIFPFLFFFFFIFHKFTLRIRLVYTLVDPKIHFYKYRSQYFSSVFDIFLENSRFLTFLVRAIRPWKIAFSFLSVKKCSERVFPKFVIVRDIPLSKTFTRIVRLNDFERERLRKYS